MKSYLTIDSPFGDLAVLFRVRPFAVLKIFLPSKSKRLLLEAVRGEGAQDPVFNENAESVSEMLAGYFKGKPVSVPWQWMDMHGLTELQQAVLRAAADIPYGQVRSYRQMAETIGRPRAFRFVGTTLAKNPFPILIPCHRVVKSDGSLGKFGGGTALKKKLIDLEIEYARRMDP